MKSIYIIGSLRNPQVPKLGMDLRRRGFDVFDDWYGAGEKADDAWQAYEKQRGRKFAQALAGYAAQHVFQMDKTHLQRCDAAVLVIPAGRSGHLELGVCIGSGKPGFILMPGEPDRFDLMYNFSSGVFTDKKKLFKRLKQL